MCCQDASHSSICDLQIACDRRVAAAALGSAQQARHAAKRREDERAAAWAVAVLADRAEKAAARAAHAAEAEIARVKVSQMSAAGLHSTVQCLSSALSASNWTSQRSKMAFYQRIK